MVAAHYLCKTSKKSRTSDLQYCDVCRPFAGGLGGPARLGSAASSSLDSRFRFVEELIEEAGESGRDNGATPLTWGAMTAGEAMVDGRVAECPWKASCGMAAVEDFRPLEARGGMARFFFLEWSLWFGRVSSRFASAANWVLGAWDRPGRLQGLKVLSPVGRHEGGKKDVQFGCMRWRDNYQVRFRPWINWFCGIRWPFLHRIARFSMQRREVGAAVAEVGPKSQRENEPALATLWATCGPLRRGIPPRDISPSLSGVGALSANCLNYEVPL